MAESEAKSKNRNFSVQQNFQEKTDIFFSGEKSTVKQLSNEITSLEGDLSKAYNNFNQCVDLTICNLNYLCLHLKDLNVKITRGKINLNDDKFTLISPEAPDENHNLLNETLETELETQIEKLKSSLEKSINKSRCHIKRSHMKMSNLVSQHNLLFLPYYELKLYNKQISKAEKKPNKCVNEITYREALQELENMLQDVQTVENGIINLLANPYSSNKSTNNITNNFLDLSIDYYCFLTDDYKCLPNQLILKKIL